MGLDISLYTTYPFRSIKWCSDNEKEKDILDKKVILTFSNNESKEIYAYYIKGIKIRDRKASLYTHPIITSIWEINSIDTENSILFITYWDEKEDKTFKANIPFEDIETITFRHSYWCKANQIFGWFEREFGEIKNLWEYPILGSKLIELRELCREVLTIENEEYSKEYLPTREGFFFGITSYGNIYYNQLQDTISQLEDIKENYIYIFKASW